MAFVFSEKLKIQILEKYSFEFVSREISLYKTFSSRQFHRHDEKYGQQETYDLSRYEV
ncbi:hypothetical protein [Leptospira weilii]|uniref:hypothetical protein n=1 Tax=Leptospira weilii TaxID=28184 RepID=UPI0002ECE35A|nr:hypothetical protein [Leptospira weilii]